MTRVEIVMKALGLEIARKRGRRAWALCPFHDDHDATNFFVRIEGSHVGSYHCFACKAGGSLIDLVMRRRGVDYKTARAFVDQSGRAYEPPRARVRVVERAPMLGRARFALPAEGIFDEPLDQWVTLAREYATRRHLTQAEIDRYRIGYAVDGRLGGRIIFPVLGSDTRPVSYSARSFVGDARKYLTPQESEDADLDGLFGEHLWPQPSDRRVICVTEGAINALACARATGLHACSISGSEVRSGHVIKLGTFRYVVVLTDPDAAGERAAAGLRARLGRRVHVVRVRLPPGKDADDLASEALRLTIVRALVGVVL